MTRIKKTLLAIGIIVPVSWVGFTIYAMSTFNLEKLIICSTSDGAYRIPKSVCEYYTIHFRGTKEDIANLEKGIGLTFALNDTKNTKFINFLLEKGANINLVSPLDGTTPLHAAVLLNEPELVKFLLDHGADATIRKGKSYSSFAEFDGMTPLEMLIKMEQNHPGQTDRNKVKALLEVKR
jgi:hypothetical protein